MVRIGCLCLLLVLLALCMNRPICAEENAPSYASEINVHPVSSPPKIDGVLDDPVWQEAPLELGEWLTYNPLYGDKMAQQTKVWISHDESNLYFAFHCLDSEPEKIKTSISRRDTIFNDDWVGMSFDAMGNGQSAYEMLVNPSGVQVDMLYSASSNEDTAPDWVWESVGKRTEDGYIVEIRLPFKSIRFKSGKDVRMGVIFFRRVSRLGMSCSWPHLPPGKSWLMRHAPLLLRDIKQPLMLEAIPNLTYSLNQKRSTPQDWSSPDTQWNAGLTVKYGISSSVTLDGTIKPDFSQVESDAFQVEVNQRYPVFYSEKRPFFMEGMEAFNLAGSGGDGNMRTTVHTRRILDPTYGMKLTGTIGKMTFATLSASDQAPGNADAGDPQSDERKAFNVARALYSLGKGSYAGALYTDTRYAGGSNRVTAGDISLQTGEHQRFSATLMDSRTLAPGGDAKRSGMAGLVYYLYNSKRTVFETQVEHYDKDFQMDTAFYNRTGFTSGWIYSGMNFYPDAKRHSWFKRFSPFVLLWHGQDRIQGGVDEFGMAGAQLSFTKQGFLRFDTGVGREPWAGRVFSVRQSKVFGAVQLTKWFKLEGNLRTARSIFYDPLQPFSGSSNSQYLGITLQPNSKLKQTIGYSRVTFDRGSDGARIYTVDIVNLRTIYQFDKRFFLRTILQYDSSQKRALADFVASYELIPGTVAYAGYGALFEREQWDGQQMIPGRGDYQNTQRSLFFKVSYLYRL